MDNKKLSFIKCAFHDNSLVCQSWGTSNLVFSQNEVKFHVNALKFKGEIIITYYKENIFCIKFKNDVLDYKIFSTKNDIIKVIDNIIEFDEDYKTAIQKLGL